MTKILIVESNPATLSAEVAERDGKPLAEGYAEVLLSLQPDLEIEIARPYDHNELPELSDFDGVVFTGSSVPWNTDDARAAPLADVMRKVFAEGLPTIGSCNGMQLAASVLGGSSDASPNGREDGMARDIALTEAGKSHPMMAGRADVYAVPCVHRDEVFRMPEGAVLLAGNAHSPVQAFAYEVGDVKFWGMQYHPEYTPEFVGVYLQTRDGPDNAQALDLVTAQSDADAAARLGTTPQAQALATRTLELRNWLAQL